MGVPGSSNGDVFHAWAKLPIPREQYREEQAAEQAALFPECAPLPGAASLLGTLARLRPGVHVALASSCEAGSFALKTAGPASRALLDLIPPGRRVLARPTVVVLRPPAKGAP